MSQLQTFPSRPITSIEISENDSKVHAKLHFEKPYENVTMKFSESEEFKEFLKNFLVNQETPLRVFKFLLSDLKILQDSLKSRISLLQVRRIFLQVSDTSQLAPIFQHLNSYTLKKVILRIDGKFDVDELKMLENWKRSGLLILAFKFESISLKNLESINKLLYHWSTFRQIDIFYDSYEHDPFEFFDVPFEELSENSIRIELSPRNRLAPSLVKQKLSNEMSLKVLGNPLVMGNILKYFKAFDILNLRKTCNKVRSCVDHLKPDPQIGIYGIYMKTDNSISVNVRVSGYRNCKSISYERNEDSKDIVSKVLADFETILKNQKTCLEELRLFFSYYNLTGTPNEPLKTLIPERLNPMTSKFLAGFKEILKRRSGLLKVKKLDLFSVRSEDVMQVLPFLDPESLEKLEINDPHYEYRRLYNRRDYPDALKIPYDIEEMAKTEQWKILRELEVKSKRISTPIPKMNLTNLSKIYITTVDRITTNDIIFLKEMNQLQTLPNRPVISLKISKENSKIHAKFYFQKPYENVTMEFLESKEFETFLKDFMISQETPLRVFKFELPDLKILEESLKSRNSLLQVRRIFLDVSDTNQMAQIFQHLNSYTLKKVILRKDRVLDADEIELLENWKRNWSGSLNLVFKIETISSKSLESINMLLFYWSKFRQIDIFYDSYEYDPCKFFDVPFEKLSEN
ncbi:hypothetical protein B9Z55_018141 [Caenorhabditis nigoni]|uniref:F-box domain-containing protein n=1 Tax=Caenorhabditis nigoni TaxID=1611254 RepID=A0A2G5TCR2_9PELO|nr:hypothetical protein B9Z55_018141 [Caenorhabditis nigoni]